MFQSSSTARHPILSAIAGDDQHVWTYVNLAVNRPWFLLAYALHTSEGDIDENVLLSSPEQVVDLLRRNGNEITVSQLMLVSPKHLNQSEHWQMDPLVEIWRGQRGNCGTLTYRLADGRQYIHASGALEPSPLENPTCLVSFDQRVVGDPGLGKPTGSPTPCAERDDANPYAVHLAH